MAVRWAVRTISPRPASIPAQRGAAAGAAVGEGLRSVRVVGVQPAHHRLRVSARAHGDTRGAARSHDLVERQEALAGAPVGRAHRQPTQVLLGVWPQRACSTDSMVGQRTSAGQNATPPSYPKPRRKLWASNWTRFSRRRGPRVGSPASCGKRARPRKDPPRKVSRSRRRPAPPAACATPAAANGPGVRGRVPAGSQGSHHFRARRPLPGRLQGRWRQSKIPVRSFAAGGSRARSRGLDCRVDAASGGRVYRSTINPSAGNRSVPCHHIASSAARRLVGMRVRRQGLIPALTWPRRGAGATRLP